MKKISISILLAGLIFVTGCTKQVVLLDQNVETSKKMLDNFVKTTGYSYKLKDDENNIYNVHVMEYNLQYLLQSKPIVSLDLGFTCRFKEIDKINTLMDCRTYGGNAGFSDIKRHLKDLKQEDIKYVSYKKYKKLNNSN